MDGCYLDQNFEASGVEGNTKVSTTLMLLLSEHIMDLLLYNIPNVEFT